MYSTLLTLLALTPMISASTVPASTPKRFHVTVSGGYLTHLPNQNITLHPKTAAYAPYQIMGFANETLSFYASEDRHARPHFLSVPNVRTVAATHPAPVTVVSAMPVGYAAGQWGAGGDDGAKTWPITYAVNPGNRGSFYICTVGQERIFTFGEYATDDCVNQEGLAVELR